ncbi:MAG TPA: phosphoribosylformylglycinamidine synthase subunit PurQ, partial [Gammaproteobacteria bacterium]|nr:phosphoribosylformylglycinamidine synthase subunit PurQ [Gammaproteobacteria bacterium]
NTALEYLANEELGAVLQIRSAQYDAVLEILNTWNLAQCTHVLAQINRHDEIIVRAGDSVLFSAPRVQLQQHWSRVSYEMRHLRDNPLSAAQEYAHILDDKDPGLSAQLSYDLNQNVAAPFIHTQAKPRVAILREQGVNGQNEMAAAFTAAGFVAVDVHMSDILSGKNDLSTFKGLAACGGFSYGDVLGAGRGWASTILYHERAEEVFSRFFLRLDTFTLGVCNGCQMFAALKTLLPQAQSWPDFVQNESTQFEARLVQVEVLPSPSIFFKDMAGSRMPIIVSHGEGRAVFAPDAKIKDQHVTLRYVDHYGKLTEKYPFNPNGSPNGITGLTTPNGRITIMMPHPERMFRALQCSWRDPSWADASPWRRMFENARIWVG